MLTLAKIRENKDQIIQKLIQRNIGNADQIIASIIELDDSRKSTQVKLDEELNQSNKIAKSIGQLLKNGEKEAAEAAKGETAALKASVKNRQAKMAEITNDMNELLYHLPNIHNDNVPVGNTIEENEVLAEHGQKPVLKSKTPHWDLIKKYDIIDFELGNKIAGAGFPVYKGKGARLQRALINFFLDEATKIGYHEIAPPILINEASGIGTGQLPDKEGQMYHCANDDLFLIPTAEVPITNIYRDVLVNEKDLPIRNVGYTPCFRREAGSWGAHVRGLNRLHQFDKVEIIQIRKPDESYDALEEMRNYVEGLLTKLNLPFRTLNLCSGDLGFTSAQTYDMEVWSAGQERWLEVSSVSNFEDFQANRLKLRYKNEKKKSVLLHTLNGSALALPRIMAALLENNLTDEGIKIPEVLVPYTGFEMIN